jgi:hypothetical protein
MTTLLDHTSTPTVRETIGRLMTAATHADVAVAHVRLAGIDLQPEEIARLEKLRLLLARFDATFAADAHALMNEPQRAEHLKRLLGFVESGRVEIRSTSVALWLPDFSVFRGIGPEQPDTLVLGAHYFRELFTPKGTALTCIVLDEAAIGRAVRCFDSLWERGYDIRPAITDTLRDALRCANGS